MNNLNPLIPENSPAEQKTKSRARVKIAVFFVLAVHIVVLGVLLMQGCKREEQPPTTDTNPPPILDTNPPPILDTNPPPMPPPVSLQATPPVPDNNVGGMTEYTVVKGDSFYTIAKKFHVTQKAVQDANPGVEPTKLQLGQKITVPAPTAPVSAPMGAAPTAHADTADNVYSVKSGDTLTKIAADHGITLKALRAANNLTTDKIKVGQKIKIPVKAAPLPPAEATPPAPMPVTPVATPPSGR